MSQPCWLALMLLGAPARYSAPDDGLLHTSITASQQGFRSTACISLRQCSHSIPSSYAGRAMQACRTSAEPGMDGYRIYSPSCKRYLTQVPCWLYTHACCRLHFLTCTGVWAAAFVALACSCVNTLPMLSLTPEACCRGEAVAVLAVGVHCCEVVKLCAIQGAQVLVVALGYTPLACTCCKTHYAKHTPQITVNTLQPPPQQSAVRRSQGSQHPSGSRNWGSSMALQERAPETALTGSSAGAVCAMSGVAPSKPMYLQNASAAGWPQSLPLLMHASTCLPSMLSPPAWILSARKRAMITRVFRGSCPCRPNIQDPVAKRMLGQECPERNMQATLQTLLKHERFRLTMGTVWTHLSRRKSGCRRGICPPGGEIPSPTPTHSCRIAPMRGP